MSRCRVLTGTAVQERGSTPIWTLGKNNMSFSLLRTIKGRRSEAFLVAPCIQIYLDILQFPKRFSPSTSGYCQENDQRQVRTRKGRGDISGDQQSYFRKYMHG